jgi:hypothetical protein
VSWLSVPVTNYLRKSTPSRKGLFCPMISMVIWAYGATVHQGGQEAERGGQEELESHTSSDLTSSHWVPHPKASTLPSSTTGWRHLSFVAQLKSPDHSKCFSEIKAPWSDFMALCFAAVIWGKPIELPNTLSSNHLCLNHTSTPRKSRSTPTPKRTEPQGASAAPSQVSK